ncbi:MAG: 16S rRNA (cytosine(1402)-N(4))-methyltransferase RsmH [Bacteroidetes bacterium]|nr:16S rRNA (cytosine(1402)-N(4))-methyltransferase RsmH [Bacteroidota bacterium]
MQSKKNKKNHYSHKIDKSKIVEYNYHHPVLLDESIELLINDKNGTYIDGTLGGGGHAKKIMQNLNSGGNLFAFDKDINAIKHVKSLLLFEEELKQLQPAPSFVPFNTSFSKACDICKERNIKPAGLLLDLGVSSQQLDTDQRGMSYRVDCPLDMRFGNEGITAQEIINTYSEEDIANILFKYGEEPRNRQIAKAIVGYRKIHSINTTFELRSIIENITSKQYHFKTLSRVFQAIRIEVNHELEELSNTLNDIIDILIPGGRIVVISYHSLEDRVVKQIFKENSATSKINKYSVAKSTNVTKLRIITHKPIVPSEQEILINPRARSAKMRVAEKLN